MDEEYKKQQEIFTANLIRLMKKYGRTQREVADSIEVSNQVFNTWMKGKSIPRMNKVQRLADYFNVPLRELIEPYEEPSEDYYLNKETAEIANRVLTDKDLRVLFDAAQDSKPEDIKMAADLLKRLKGTNIDG